MLADLKEHILNYFESFITTNNSSISKKCLTCFIILLDYWRYNFVYLHTVPWALTLAIRLKMVCQKLATLKDQAYCFRGSFMASEPNWELEFLTNNLVESQIRIAEKSCIVFSLLGLIDKLKLRLCCTQLTRVCSVNFTGNNGRIVSHKLDQIE